MTKIDQELRQLRWYELYGNQDPDYHWYGFFGDAKDAPEDLNVYSPNVIYAAKAYTRIFLLHDVNEEDDLWPYYIIDYEPRSREREVFGGMSLEELEAFYKKTKEFVKIKKCEKTKRLKTKGASNDIT